MPTINDSQSLNVVTNNFVVNGTGILDSRNRL